MQPRNVDFAVQIFFECFSFVVFTIADNVPSIKVVFSFTHSGANTGYYNYFHFRIMFILKRL